MTLAAILGAEIFDGRRRHRGAVLLLRGALVEALVAPGDLPADCPRLELPGGLLAPGFLDLQVNGGGGVLVNDDPAPATMGRIARAHRRFGTTALLPTLITDTADMTAAAIAAATLAVSTEPGVIGLHLEGPHLAPARRGAHRADLMRPLGEADVDQLIAAREAIGTLVVTLAVEQAAPALIRRLADGGVIVALGHSDAAYDDAMAAFDAGARLATHLFNAMSPLGHRAPGLVGAALDAGEVWCGLIADGHHVHPAAAALAVRGKRPPGRCFLVTDAMATVGSDTAGFRLGGRDVRRIGDRLELEDGTLAGSTADMAACVAHAAKHLDVSFDEALRMASLHPATALRLDDLRGRIAPGMAADLVWLDGPIVRGTWIGGVFERA